MDEDCVLVQCVVCSSLNLKVLENQVAPDRVFCDWCNKQRIYRDVDMVKPAFLFGKLFGPAQPNAMSCRKILRSALEGVQSTFATVDAASLPSSLNFVFKLDATAIGEYMGWFWRCLAKGVKDNLFSQPDTSIDAQEIAALERLTRISGFIPVCNQDLFGVNAMFCFLNDWRSVQTTADPFPAIALIMRCLSNIFRMPGFCEHMLAMLGDHGHGVKSPAETITFWVDRLWALYQESLMREDPVLQRMRFLHVHDAISALAAFIRGDGNLITKNVTAVSACMPGLASVLNYLADIKCTEVPLECRQVGVIVLADVATVAPCRMVLQQVRSTVPVAVQGAMIVQRMLDIIESSPRKRVFRGFARVLGAACMAMRMFLLDLDNVKLLCSADRLPSGVAIFPLTLSRVLHNADLISDVVRAEALGSIWNIAAKGLEYSHFVFALISDIVQALSDSLIKDVDYLVVERALGALVQITRHSHPAVMMLARSRLDFIDLFCGVVRKLGANFTGAHSRASSVMLHISTCPEACALLGLARPAGWSGLLKQLRKDPDSIDDRNPTAREKLRLCLRKMVLMLYPLIREPSHFQDGIHLMRTMQDLGLLREDLERRPIYERRRRIEQHLPAEVALPFQFVRMFGGNYDLRARFIKHPDDSLSVLAPIIKRLMYPPADEFQDVRSAIVASLDQLLMNADSDYARRVAIRMGVLDLLRNWFIIGRQVDPPNEVATEYYAQICDTLRASIAVAPTLRGAHIAALPRCKEAGECAICKEPLSMEVARTFPCTHSFHEKCASEWFCRPCKNTCPVCRVPFLPSDPQEWDPEYRKFSVFQRDVERVLADKSLVPALSLLTINQAIALPTEVNVFPRLAESPRTAQTPDEVPFPDA